MLDQAWEIAKAAGSVAGGLTFAWKIYDFVDARRARLSLRTIDGGHGRYEVLVTYRARSEEVGLVARLRIIKPKGGTLALHDTYEYALTVDQAQAIVHARGAPSVVAHRSMVLSEKDRATFTTTADLFIGHLGADSAQVAIEIRNRLGKLIDRRRVWLAPVD